MMKVSRPRTFSRISTKISRSAKRRTWQRGQRFAEIGGDRLGERPVGIARQDLHLALHQSDPAPRLTLASQAGALSAPTDANNKTIP